MRIIGITTESTYLNVLLHDAKLCNGSGEHELHEISLKSIEQILGDTSCLQYINTDNLKKQSNF